MLKINLKGNVLIGDGGGCDRHFSAQLLMNQVADEEAVEVNSATYLVTGNGVRGKRPRGQGRPPWSR